MSGAHDAPLNGELLLHRLVGGARKEKCAPPNNPLEPRGASSRSRFAIGATGPLGSARRSIKKGYKMDSDTLKSRGIYFIGLGILLVGIAAIVWSCTKIAETIYFRKFMASGTWPSNQSIMGERSRELPEPGIIVSNDTISFPMPATEERKAFNVEPKEKK